MLKEAVYLDLKYERGPPLLAKSYLIGTALILASMASLYGLSF